MFPGGINPKNMQRMMKQLGIKTEELNAKKVVFELVDKKLVIENPNVTVMTVQGKKTYTVMGDVKEEAAGVPEEDVKMVAEQAGVPAEDAKKALEDCDGDIAEAILKLKG